MAGRMAITTTEEHGRKVYVNEDGSGPETCNAGGAAEAVVAGVLEQQRKPVEAGAFGGHGLNAGGAVGRG